MLLRHRTPAIDSGPLEPAEGFEHLDRGALAVIRWLLASQIDCVLVGPLARAIRGEPSARGAVAIVPAPYGRNLDRLTRALSGTAARLRMDFASSATSTEQPPLARLTAEHLLRVERWTVRCGVHDLDIEGHPPGAPRYQELLYEAARFEPAAGIAIEVAAPEDVEFYDYVRRTGSSPEIRVIQAARHLGHA